VTSRAKSVATAVRRDGAQIAATRLVTVDPQNR
jgi:hypothetical protein